MQRKALVVLFQHWFSAAAEEASVASKVAACLKEVKKATPSLLAFLVNLADDNGNTVLHYSVSHCNYSIVSLLLDTGNTIVLQKIFHGGNMWSVSTRNTDILSSSQVRATSTFRTTPATHQ